MDHDPSAQRRTYDRNRRKSAQPLLVVGTMSNGNARALQQRVVQTGKLNGEAQPVMISRNGISCGRE
jgi:hypothetical protein